MKTIVVVCKDIVLTNTIDRTLKNSYQRVIFSSISSALDYIYNSIPDLIVINVLNDDSLTINILKDLKTDPMFHQLPVLAILPDHFNLSNWNDLLIEDFIWRGDLENDFILRVNLCITRSERIVEINPLTRLPGNISINRELQERITRNQDFSFGYADLDFFKPFNDRYGFSRGDEVIKITGRLILNIVKNKQPQGSFVGHVGGDDFVYIIDSELAEEAATEIIKAFDSIIPTFYDSEDSTQRFIKSFDRKGKASKFPIMGISIGITETVARSFTHYGEITELAAEMKKFAKQSPGSCFKSDKRTDEEIKANAVKKKKAPKNKKLKVR
jgi:diguanylate cyclase (GGDEF)-like protein